MAEIKITATNFETEVLHSDKPVLVDFWAAGGAARAGCWRPFWRSLPESMKESCRWAR